MDPIDEIKPHKDTTLAMLLAAQRRGWQIGYLELGDIWLRDGVAMGRAHRLQVRDDPPTGSRAASRCHGASAISTRS